MCEGNRNYRHKMCEVYHLRLDRHAVICTKSAISGQEPDHKVTGHENVLGYSSWQNILCVRALELFPRGFRE
jgi:hypothetical protein